MPTTSPGAPGASPFDQAKIAARELGRLTGAEHHDALVVLGTGLSRVAAALGAEGPPIDLTALPWFGRFSGPDHRPQAWSVAVGPLRTLLMAGRLHLYEGRSPAEVVHPVRTAVAAGVRTVVLTCSAGAVNPSLATGQVVAISDHLNLSGTSPLVGAADPAFPDRHVDLVDAWSPELRAAARRGNDLAEGVYAYMVGPQLETPAEIRMLATLGADLVGMSTVPEAIAARHLGADVLGLAVVTNAAAGMEPGPLRLADVLVAAEAASGTVSTVVRSVLETVGAGAGRGVGPTRQHGAR